MSQTNDLIRQSRVVHALATVLVIVAMAVVFGMLSMLLLAAQRNEAALTAQTTVDQRLYARVLEVKEELYNLRKECEGNQQ